MRAKLLVVLVTGLFSVWHTTAANMDNQFTCFIPLTNFTHFTSGQTQGQTSLCSPPIKSPIPWNQLIVSWNAFMPSNSFLKLEVAATAGNHQTTFYTLANWSLDNQPSPRASVAGQQDADGAVETDTLVLKLLADSAHLRITLGGSDGALPVLKFLGLSFANTTVPPVVHPPNRAAWGKTISTPERSQYGHGGEKGWCSPTSLSMVLARWAQVLHRPELDLPVPQVAAGVYDSHFDGTGNWPFNTAFAGHFKALRAYVTRFDDLSEVEDWVAAGIPVILSARWDWLVPGRVPDSEGHLLVCIGFTKDGDVIVNDPATHLERGDTVQRIYKRADVLHAWSKSHHAVYLVYPEDAQIPPDRFGHWAH